MAAEAPPSMDTGSQQAPAKANAPTCYNCGDSGHYFDACPEPARKIPAGLAAAQAAKANAGPQSHHGGYGGQDHRSKRQKTGSGPVVTRYPVPGPVVTRYCPPPIQHPPYGEPQGYNGMPPQQFPQGQYGSHPQQQFAPQNGYPPYGYQGSPMPQGYNQYGHHPPAPYGQGYGSMPAQGQGYGYGPPASSPYYGQPYGPQAPYGPPVPQQYPHQAPVPYPPQQSHIPYQQQNMQQPADYGPPQQAGPYQPGPYPQGGPQAPPNPYNMPQQHPQAHTQGQPPVPYQSFQGQGTQGYNENNGPYPNQQSQQGVQTPVPMHGSPAAGDPSNHSDQGNAQAGKSSGQPESSHDDESAVKNQPTHTTDDADNTQGGLGHDTTIDEFDIDWEESVFNDLLRVVAIAILTPLSTQFDEEPLTSDASDAPIKSKYVRPGNLEVFILPIQKSLHWAILHTDPALAKIDEAYPAVPFEMWEEYREERKKRKMLEARLHDNTRDDQSRESIQEDADDQAMRESSTESMGRQESNRSGVRQFSAGSQRDSRSRSRTLGYSRRGTPTLEDGDELWASRPDEAAVKMDTYVDPAEAVLASLGVMGAPKPVSVNTAVYNDGQKEPSSPRGKQMRQDSGYASARPSIGRQSSWNNGPAFRRPSKRTRHRSGYDGCIDSPISEVSMRSHNSERDVGKRGSKSMSPVESPLSPTSAALVGEAPASHEDRYRSSEPLRQNDDQYVKKRPQPKVAEAYSRRW
ncbi:hypothetical protein VC83_06871 [Pseudogymnoascus destructans]|uniref:CCHC-type domain-containing protein n=2 Tax=Pseudogymnoascus destructans TaxID=655981 RepID=L8GBS4_PSED2|nr:uncharacterized protein VC83_06871 [Pseudogymnoascus destructans]ELR10650.1 hypothetical protein GMDG_04917 [Pseudogymnoascus destructans 20631-21]OAF56396.1 hypothetical protein VC83_06871 [Pseudogymnoascus destructans]